METLRFKVEKQHIEYIPPHSYLVAGTHNKVAAFEQKYYVPIFNSKCRVPDDVARLKRFSVRVVGQKRDVRNVTDFTIVDQR